MEGVVECNTTTVEEVSRDINGHHAGLIRDFEEFCEQYDPAVEDDVEYNPPTIEEVFGDIKGRRAGLIRALTTDVMEFYQLCDPEKENLCLYGFSDEQWDVDLPAPEVPPELPEPAMGINFARDGMKEKDWLSLIAVHSDSWLHSVAFYYGARFGFNKEDRECLFDLINDLPTIYEVVSEAANSKSKSNSKVCEQPQPLQTHVPKHEQKEVDSFKDELSMLKIVDSVQDDLSRLKIKQLPFLGKDLNGMGLNDLWQLEHQLYEELLAIKDRKEELLLQQLVEHSRRQDEYSEKVEVKDEDAGVDEVEKEHGDSLHGACGENYASDEFLICSDTDTDLEGWVRVLVFPSLGHDD